MTTKRKEFKVLAPDETMKKVRSMLATYGSRRILSDKTGISYDKICYLKKHKKAVKSVIDTLNKFEL